MVPKCDKIFVMKSLALLIASLFLIVHSLDLNTIRVAYKEAAHDKTKVEVFHKKLSQVTKKDRIELVAYKGAVIALVAKKSKSLKRKKEGFIEGISLVEYAIEKAPYNIESRFIRLGIQENTPRLLKYKSNIDEDKHFILKQFTNIKSSSLKNHIKDYISQSKVFTDEEKSVILDL